MNIRAYLLICVGVIFTAGIQSATAADLYWDGADTTGDADGGIGTWDNGSTANWDDSASGGASVTWANDPTDEAFFGGTAGTVTLGEDITVSNMTFTSSGNYTIQGETLHFSAGATIDQSVKDMDLTILSAIIGSPDVRVADGTGYVGLRFAPTNGTVTLGTADVPYEAGTGDKAGLRLGGTTTGNSVGNISYTGGQYGKVAFESGGWTATNGIDIGWIEATGGTHLLGGLLSCHYGTLRLSGTSKVMGTFTNWASDRRVGPCVWTGATIAPGDGVGTITFDWPDGSQVPEPNWGLDPNYPKGKHSFTMMGGSKYEWEVGPEATDTIHMMQGGLYVSNTVTLVVVDAGGSPKTTDRLPVFTYDPAGDNMTTPDTATLNANITIDLSGTPYSVGTPSLVNDSAGTIYLTGIAPPAKGTVLIIR